MPSQVSGEGLPAVALHVTLEQSPRHMFVPIARHAPTPTVHAAPTSNPLSTVPSQSLSPPSHASAGGDPALALLCVLSPPLAQTNIPLTRQAPTPTAHVAPTLKPSSTRPLQ